MRTRPAASSQWVRTWLAAATLPLWLAALGASSAAFAQEAPLPTNAAMDFAIPRQSLQTALEAYSAITHFQILYSAELVRGKQAGPVQGVFTPPVALALLLRGTGLRVRYTSERSITLFAATSEKAEASVLAIRPIRVEGPAGPSPAQLRYAQRLATVVARAIQRDPVTGRGSYAVRLRLWLSAEGQVTRAEVISVTPGASAAMEIPRVLGGMKIADPPPPGLPQPLVYDFQVGRTR